MENIVAKPFLKWAGGKSQLLDEIRRRFPNSFGKNINKYVEPFVGGGAVLFDVLNNYDLKEIYINDINVELVNVYRVIKDSVFDLIKILSLYQSEYIPMDDEKRKEYYYDKRDRFNSLILGDITAIEKASLFIFLNRTCFNGLYRVNSKGEFNVPIGKYKNPKICDKENLVNVSKKLQRVNIISGDYKLCDDYIDESTFVYIDPPYRPLNISSSFTSYTKFDFDDNSQIELAKFYSKLNNKNAYILLSNSDPHNIDVRDDFFDDLYEKYHIDRIKASRRINSKAKNRGEINEILVYNYKIVSI